MLKVSDSIKNAYNQYTTQRKSYIQCGNNSFFIQNLDIFADAYNDGNVIGNAISKIAKFNIETKYVKGLSEFEIFDGIWTGNQYEYISLGTFKLFNEEGTDDFFSSITAYDKLINFNQVYDPSLISFPISLYNFTKEICQQANVIFSNSSLPNGNKIIESNLFVENETLKTILNAICQINGCFGIISKDKLKLLLKGTETLKLTKDQLSSPEYKRTTWKINQVVLGMTDVEGEYVLRQDEADIAKNGVHKLVINDNPFVYTQDLRESYIDNLFNQIKGFGYTAFETKWEGLSYVELGDLLNIDGKESIILRYNLKSPNGLDSTLSAPSIIDSVVGYADNSNSIENKQKRTEYIVDKQNQKMTSIVQAQEEQSEQLSEVIQTVDTIKQQISGEYGMTEEINGINQLYIKDALKYYPLELKIQGYSDLRNMVYPRNIYPGLNLHPLKYIEEELSQITLCIDNQSKNNPSENLKEYIIDIKEPLRSLGNIKDEINFRINTDGTIEYVLTRYLYYSGNQINVLETPTVEILKLDYIELLEHENYIYIKEDLNYPLYVKYLIYSEMNEFYATKVELNSSITQTQDSILSQVSKTYAEKAEVSSQINQTAEEISLEVSKKVGEEEIISKINQSIEGITILANKLGLTANDIINLIAGNSINLTSKNITINSNNFSVDSNGNMTCNNATANGLNINNGNINLTSISENSKITLNDSENSSCKYEQSARTIKWTGLNGGFISMWNTGTCPILSLTDNVNNSHTNLNAWYIETPELRQTSLEKNKKNFEKFEGALNLIDDIDLYKYNLKQEKNDHKKHIGFVIGDKYKYSSEITSVDEEGNETGVDLYSMTSLCLQAIKEQKEIINKLKSRIEVLENEKN